MRYMEIRGEKGSGKTGMGLLYAKWNSSLIIATSKEHAYELARRKEKGDNSLRMVRVCKSFRELDNDMLLKGMVGVVVDRVEEMECEEGKTIEESLRGLAEKRGMSVVAIWS